MDSIARAEYLTSGCYGRLHPLTRRKHSKTANSSVHQMCALTDLFLLVMGAGLEAEITNILDKGKIALETVIFVG